MHRHGSLFYFQVQFDNFAKNFRLITNGNQSFIYPHKPG